MKKYETNKFQFNIASLPVYLRHAAMSHMQPYSPLAVAMIE